MKSTEILKMHFDAGLISEAGNAPVKEALYQAFLSRLASSAQLAEPRGELVVTVTLNRWWVTENDDSTGIVSDRMKRLPSGSVFPESQADEKAWRDAEPKND